MDEVNMGIRPPLIAEMRPLRKEVKHFDGDVEQQTDVLEWINGEGGKATPNISLGGMDIETLEGPLHVSLGDYVIRGVKGEFYPCKPEVFEQSYGIVKHGEPTLAERFDKAREDRDHERNRRYNAENALYRECELVAQLISATRGRKQRALLLYRDEQRECTELRASLSRQQQRYGELEQEHEESLNANAALAEEIGTLKEVLLMASKDLDEKTRHINLLTESAAHVSKMLEETRDLRDKWHHQSQVERQAREELSDVHNAYVNVVRNRARATHQAAFAATKKVSK